MLFFLLLVSLAFVCAPSFCSKLAVNTSNPFAALSDALAIVLARAFGTLILGAFGIRGITLGVGLARVIVLEAFDTTEEEDTGSRPAIIVRVPRAAAVLAAPLATAADSADVLSPPYPSPITGADDIMVFKNTG